MAFFMLHGNSSSSSARFYMLSFILLVFVCSFSYCSSSFGSSSIGTDENAHFVDNDKYINGENNYDVGSSSEVNQLNTNEKQILLKSHLLNILFNSILAQDKEDHRYRRYPNHFNNRRYVPQSFHAMRG